VVAHWYAESWSREKARGRAADYARAWESDGVAKWMAYDRTSGEAVGRGGLSRMAAEDDLTRQISALLPDGRWSEHRLELGWALRSEFHGQGLATEIGRAGLAFAFGDLGADVVVAFTERHNHASRAVMERLAMRPVGEITGPGLVEGRDGVHDGARFAVYAATR
jgi:RimJ/RimL family protein N-acetyltransferase